MIDPIRKLFKSLYPAKAKAVESVEGRKIRKVFLMGLIIHIFLFFFNFIIVGFQAMFMNVILSCITYSCYLTVREKEMIFYLIFLLFEISQEVYCLRKVALGNNQLLGTLVDIVIYFTLLVMVGRTYYGFRQSGGLRGKGKAKDLIEDKISKKVKEFGAAATKKSLEVINDGLHKKKAEEPDQEN